MDLPPSPHRPLTPVPRLALRGIRKRFGRVQALGGVDFDVGPGEVHALLGENGAGKSTLMRVAYGLIRADEGSVAVEGAPRNIGSPREARRLGLGMVHQHFTSIPALTVTENIRLFGGDPTLLSAPRDAGGAGHLASGLTAEARVSSLSVSLKQRLEIVKALAAGSRVLLLDEPTAVLAPAEVEEMLTWARGFAAGGGSVVLITHKLDEALAAAHRVTVLRHGVVTLSGDVGGQTAATLARAMLGETPRREPVRPARRASPGATAVHADNVALPSLRDSARDAISDLTMTVAAGELVGIAALEGSGQRELLLALAGLHPVRSGRLMTSSPVALVPEDRSTEGLIPALTLTQNVVLGFDAEAPWVRRGRWIDWAGARRRTAELIAEFDIRAPGPETPAVALSGGNQQKLVLGRALARDPRVLVAENPTRGLDLHAVATVHDRLRAAAADGVAVIVYSTDLDEVLTLAERVLVVARGRVTEAPPGADRDTVGRMMLALEGER